MMVTPLLTACLVSRREKTQVPTVGDPLEDVLDKDVHRRKNLESRMSPARITFMDFCQIERLVQSAVVQCSAVGAECGVCRVHLVQ